MRKRFQTWFAAFMVIALFAGTPAGAEAEERLLFNIVAADDDEAWIHTSEGLVRFSSDGETASGAFYPDADCYALGPDGHIYYSAGGDIIEVDKNGAEVDRWETPFDSFTKMLVNETYILAMGNGEYAVIHADTHELMGGTADGLSDIGFYNEKSFFLLHNGHLVLLKLSTMDAVDIDHSGWYDGIAHSAEGEAQYLYAQNHIDVLKNFESSIENYANLSVNGSIGDICITDKTIWYIEDFALKHCSRSDFEKKAEKKLYIVGQITANGDDRLNRAIEIFEAQYPEYTVQIKTQGIGAPMKTALMANSAGYDVLMIDSPSSAVFKNSGMVADLSENIAIRENLESYVDMPFLWEEDGSLYGVPMFVHPDGLMTRMAFMGEIEEQISQDWTWEDFAALADEAEELGLCLVQENTNWNILLQQYNSAYCDFVAGEADYANDTFAELVSMWKELTDKGAVCYSGEKEPMLIYGMMDSSQTMNRSRYVYLGMPTLDGENAIPIYMTALYANKYSENADAAVRFLEIYSSAEAQNAYRSGMNGAFLPDLTMYAEYPMWEMMGLYPEEDMEMWRGFLVQGKLMERELEQDKRVRELVSDLIANKMTVDEFVAEMQENADLMIGE